MQEIRSFDGRHVIAHWWTNPNENWIEVESNYPEYFSAGIHPDDLKAYIGHCQSDFAYWQNNIRRKIEEYKTNLEKWV